MKVDLTGLTGSTLDGINSPQHNTAVERATTSASSEPTGVEDTATLSVDSSAVNSLVAKALDAPDIRQDKVEALRQAVQSGEYKVDPAQIADAMIRQSD
jgi:negative regulator of flagellin synthesis FlgM